jgi:hypothetical protein
VKSSSLIPKSGIKVPKVVIEFLIEDQIRKLDKLSKRFNEPYEKYGYKTVDLRHIKCREMKIENGSINFTTTIILPEGLEKFKAGYTQSYLVLPDSLRILDCLNDIIIKRMSQNLEELICKGDVNITDPFELPKNLSVFRAEYLGDRIRSALLSCYKDLNLKSLTIPFNIGLDFECLKTLEELYINDHDEFEMIPCFPPRLKKLYIRCSEYPTLLPEFPKTLKEFIFDLETYKFPLSKLPSGLEVLKLKGHFFERIDFPESIRKLTFSRYAHKIDFSKLCNLRVLRIENYDHDLIDLCDGLEKLIFHKYSKYNRNIILPRTVRKVRLSNSFNREIVLPESLEKIIFGDSFNQKIVLPPRVIKVIFGECFNQEIDLPDSLQEVSFEERFDRPIKRLPPNLKRLRIGKHYKSLLPSLPKTLKELKFL